MSGMDRLTELLPCPFCGGEADTMTPEADDMRAATVMCMGCYCTGKECETEAQAIAAWNRRASQAAPAPSDGLRGMLLDETKAEFDDFDRGWNAAIRAALAKIAQEG